MNNNQHPFEERQSLQGYFRTLMHTVLGQALTAAGYHLLEEPMKWIGGRFRYTKVLDAGQRAYLEFQVLVYNDNAWTGKQPSRFTINLIRDDPNRKQVKRRSLSQLVVRDFGVNILPDADYWWSFSNIDSLGKALAEAGHLLVAYGLPWLAGDLQPDDD